VALLPNIAPDLRNENAACFLSARFGAKKLNSAAEAAGDLR
jgi:hypothetical protein